MSQPPDAAPRDPQREPASPQAPERDPALNPALRSRRETTHDTTSSAPPVETASVQREEGRGWPVAWLVVAALSVAITLYLIFG